MTAPHTAPVAVICALLAACMFGCAAALQHREASAHAGRSTTRAGGTPFGLVRQPTWLLGVGLATGSYGVEALALAFGPVALVAPIAATDLLFALPLAARLAGQQLSRRDWLAAGAVASGVGVFLASAKPGEGLAGVPAGRWVAVVSTVAGVAAACVILAVARSGASRARFLAVTAGALFALLTAITKSSAEIARADGFTAVLARWQPYALVVVGFGGLLTAQTAYQAGPLPTSLPIIDILEPVGAVLIGSTVLGERLTDSPAALALQAVGAAVAIIGIVALEVAPASGRTGRGSLGDGED